MKELLFAFSILVIAFSSCRSDHYIIPVNYEEQYAGVTSLTEKESQELTRKVVIDWYKNTVGREIPDIKMKDLDGNTVKLKKWLKRETILIFAEPHCGFGAEEVEKAFPNALQNLKEDLKGIDILCLIGLAEDAEEQKTIDYAKSLQATYNNLFIIDPTDALRTNLTGSPIKFFIDKKQIVKHAQMGFTFDENGDEYSIRQGISFMRK